MKANPDFSYTVLAKTVQLEIHKANIYRYKGLCQILFKVFSEKLYTSVPKIRPNIKIFNFST